MTDALTFALGFYAGGAFLTLLLVDAPLWQRVASAALWPTFPLWRGS